ncbi:hypothetical protein AMTRI_Chr03g146740 [Amborella trichopoda]
MSLHWQLERCIRVHALNKACLKSQIDVVQIPLFSSPVILAIGLKSQIDVAVQIPLFSSPVILAIGLKLMLLYTTDKSLFVRRGLNLRKSEAC